MAKHRIELDDYEVVNLREGLMFLRDCGGDTGDWLGQIYNKLYVLEVDRSVKPNKTRYQQRSELGTRVGYQVMDWPKSENFPEGS